MKKIIWLIALIGVDQYTKYWAINNLGISRKITDFFSLRLVENTGIAFSIPVPQELLLISITLISGYLLYWLFTQKFTSTAELAFSLIAAGAIGNLIDRFMHGAVIDFLSFWSFPIFNFADVFITGGVILYLFMEIFSVPQTK